MRKLLKHTHEDNKYLSYRNLKSPTLHLNLVL